MGSPTLNYNRAVSDGGAGPGVSDGKLCLADALLFRETSAGVFWQPTEILKQAAKSDSVWQAP